MVKMTKSKTFQAYLPSCHRTYSCIHCRAHLANHDELISKSFQGSQGRAYLFNSVVNVGCGPAEERVLLTGLHAVADIYCENCKTTLGWKYVRDIHQIYFLLLCLEALFCNRPCVLVTHDRIPEGQIMCCGRSEHRGCSY
uniref:Yippee domain-containing protein n=1 Tax=Takifugu rubripes TaxID=31033 RepID=A0A3B5K6D3_TAKRU